MAFIKPFKQLRVLTESARVSNIYVFKKYFAIDLVPWYWSGAGGVFCSIDTILFVSVRASTIRAVTSESATGTTKKEKVRTMLTLTIEDIDYDTEACKLSLKGRNIEENPHVKMGAYHRLDLEMNRSVIYFMTLSKGSTFFVFNFCFICSCCSLAQTPSD